MGGSQGRFHTHPPPPERARLSPIRMDKCSKVSSYLLFANDLSIYNLIKWSDEIGATDSVLLVLLTVYLKKHKASILDVIDSKKQSISAIMEIL